MSSLSFNSGSHDWKKLIMVHHWPATVCKVSLRPQPAPSVSGNPSRVGLCEASSPRPLTAPGPLLAGPQSWAFPAGHSPWRALREVPRDRDAPPQTGGARNIRNVSSHRSGGRECIGRMLAGPVPSRSPVLASCVASAPWRCLAWGHVAPVCLLCLRGAVSVLCPSVSCKNPRDCVWAPPNAV